MELHRLEREFVYNGVKLHDTTPDEAIEISVGSTINQGTSRRSGESGGLTIHMIQSSDEVRLQVQNAGAPVEIAFDPEIPFGAKLRTASLENRPIATKLQSHPQYTHARVEFSPPHRSTWLKIDCAGGVAITLTPHNS
ncbi:MAG: hypothetical protein WB683_06745 [Candidatus Sulfotelmatobacter sp.]